MQKNIYELLKFVQDNNKFPTCEELNITQERYRKEIINALDSLQSIDFDLPIEIVAEKVRLASFAIGTITGRINTEEILGNIFG